MEFKVSPVSSPEAGAKWAPVHVGPTSGQPELSPQLLSCQVTVSLFIPAELRNSLPTEAAPMQPLYKTNPPL